MFHPLMSQLVKAYEVDSVCELGNQRYGGPGDFPSVKAYYESLGVKRYVALDITEERDAIIADLNFPVDLGETFDLVTNNGTGEHVFDQRQVFENVHNLSHKWMLHVLPMSPWFNHGFYNYNPMLFHELALSNDYKFNIFLGNRWGGCVQLPLEELLGGKQQDALKAAVAEIGNTFIIAHFKKQSDAPFRLPFQDRYKTDVVTGEMKDRYGLD